jgi:hypothetical protein
VHPAGDEVEPFADDWIDVHLWFGVPPLGDSSLVRTPPEGGTPNSSSLDTSNIQTD